MAKAQEAMVDEEPTIYEPPADLLQRALDSGRNEEPVTREARAKTALEKLRVIALDYQRSTPGEHIIFGRGQLKYTLADLRDLFGLGE